jgi:hypothetical protein
MIGWLGNYKTKHSNLGLCWIWSKHNEDQRHVQNDDGKWMFMQFFWNVVLQTNSSHSLKIVWKEGYKLALLNKDVLQ